MKKILLAASAAVLALASSVSLADTYPKQPITIINPFPGGPTDTMARLIAKKLQEGLGQPVIVDGKAGAGGTIGVAAAAKAPADGYTLLVTSASTQVVQPVIRKQLPYDAVNGFIPIMIPGQSTCVVVVNESVPARDLAELITYARENPGKLTYASSGAGTALHLAGEVFAHYANVELLHVPYRAAAPATTDLLGGQVDMMFDSPTNSAPHINRGKLRGLAIMQPTRWSTLPDIPTTTELGHPDILFANWLGLFAPAGTPADIVDRITEVLKEKMSDAEVVAYFEATGTPLSPQYGADAATTIATQQKALATVVTQAKLPLID